MKNAPNADMEPYMGVDRSAAVGPVHLVYSGTVTPDGRWLFGDGSRKAGASDRGRYEFDGGPAAHLLAENGGHRVGQSGDEARRDLAAVGTCQSRLADAERDRRRCVIGGLSADAPTSLRYAVEVDDHEAASPLAVHGDDRIG